MEVHRYEYKGLRRAAATLTVAFLALATWLGLESATTLHVVSMGGITVACAIIAAVVWRQTK